MIFLTVVVYLEYAVCKDSGVACSCQTFPIFAKNALFVAHSIHPALLISAKMSNTLLQNFIDRFSSIVPLCCSGIDDSKVSRDYPCFRRLCVRFADARGS